MDNDISDANGFRGFKILDDGRAVRFTYPCGASYDVPIRQFLTWFESPQYYRSRGRFRKWTAKVAYKAPKNLRFERGRRVLLGYAIRIVLNDGSAYEVAWDTVLMCCEPRYEWFGGLPVDRRA